MIDFSTVKNTLAEFNLKSIKSANDEDSVLIKQSNLKVVKPPVIDGKELTREDYRPSDEDLAEINSKTLVKLTKDQVYVFTLAVFDTNVDRDWEHFISPAMKGKAFDDAKLLFVDKPHLRDHKWDTDHTVGRLFKAWYEGTDVARFYVKSYILDTPEGQPFLNKLFGAVHSGVSVGFLTPVKYYFCDSCNRDKIIAKSTDYSSFTSIFDRSECSHKPGTTDEFGNTTTVSIYCITEGFEVSSTPVPAQRLMKVMPNGQKSVSLSEEPSAEAFEKTENTVEANAENTEGVETNTKLMRTQDMPVTASDNGFVPTSGQQSSMDRDIPYEMKPTVTIQSEQDQKEDKVSDEQPVIDTNPPAAPAEITSGVPLEQFDTHSIKDSVDKLSKSMADHASVTNQHIAALNDSIHHFTEHKAAMGDLCNALNEHMKCMKGLQESSRDRQGDVSVSVEPSASIAPDASTLSAFNEFATKSAEFIEKFEEIAEIMVKSISVDKLKSKLEETEVARTKSHQVLSWAETFISADEAAKENK